MMKSKHNLRHLEIICPSLTTHPRPVPLLPGPVESRHYDELQDAGEDEDHAGQHPDV